SAKSLGARQRVTGVGHFFGRRPDHPPQAEAVQDSPEGQHSIAENSWKDIGLRGSVNQQRTEQAAQDKERKHRCENTNTQEEVPSVTPVNGADEVAKADPLGTSEFPHQCEAASVDERAID